MMASAVAFTQKGRSGRAGKVRLSFDFGPDALAFTHADNSGSRSLSVGYEGIAVDHKETVVYKNTWYQYKFLVLFAVLGFAVANTEGHVWAAQWQVLIQVLGAAAVFWFIPRDVAYSLFPCGEGMIRVMQDAQHDAIVREMKARWTAYYRARYAMPDFSKARDKEIQKFHWLKKHDIISDEEFKKAIAVLQLNDDAMDVQYSSALN